jgi:hypothetical protein
MLEVGLLRGINRAFHERVIFWHQLHHLLERQEFFRVASDALEVSPLEVWANAVGERRFAHGATHRRGQLVINPDVKPMDIADVDVAEEHNRAI